MPINVNKNGSSSESNSFIGKEKQHAIGRNNKFASGRHSNSDQNSFLNFDNMSMQNISHSTNSNCRTYKNDKKYHSISTLAPQNADSISIYSQESSYRLSHISSRLTGGAYRIPKNDEKPMLSPSQCKFEAVGYHEHHKPKTNVNVMHLELHGHEDAEINRINKCSLDAKKPTKVPKTRTRGTQSLYRESSAQTLPYLPPVSNRPEDLDNMEIFKLPTILPGEGPPGLYEVEILERARKRWAFAKALKKKLRKDLQAAREKAKLPQYAHILEAFEWEHWIEREEHIQECQMLRFEILLRMFDQREKKMHTDSQLRIEQSCQEIEKKRNAALKVNEMQHQRAMRRLEMKHAGRPRVWRKEHISQGLGNPTSEFYAPKIRHGVDPGRRHYTVARKGFDMRMDDLEKKTVKMDPAHLKCPFAKLNEWSKPKEAAQEVEFNFCSETNLKKLYESMRTLREETEKPKTIPLCLKPRKSSLTVTVADNLKPPSDLKVDHIDDSREIVHTEEENGSQLYFKQVRAEAIQKQRRLELLQSEMQLEEFETLTHAYEGKTIGWLLRFLTEEMTRLMELRKHQFFTVLAKNERWQREAAEAGLRQKENIVREAFERMYQECEVANKEIAKKYVKTIMREDIDDYAKEIAEEDVLIAARQMDEEITGWLESFLEKQNPDNYYKLRYDLKDMFFPDEEKTLYLYERSACIDYIINDVIMANVFTLLEPYDVGFGITSEFVDRLIDNDLYLDSNECSSACDCLVYCTCTGTQQEARAILRKVIRRAVPGRRWRTSTERVADENVNDILDDVFQATQPRGSIIETDKSMPDVLMQFSYLNLTQPEKDTYYSDISMPHRKMSQEWCRIQTIGKMAKQREDDVTKNLLSNEELLLGDSDRQSSDKILIRSTNYTPPMEQDNPSEVHEVPSTHDISAVWDFNKTPVYCSMSDFMQEMEQEQEGEEKQLSNVELYSSEYGEEFEITLEETVKETSEKSKSSRSQANSNVMPSSEVETATETMTANTYTITGVADIVTFVPDTTTSEPDTVTATETTQDNPDDLVPVFFSYDSKLQYTVPKTPAIVDPENDNSRTTDEEKEEN